MVDLPCEDWPLLKPYAGLAETSNRKGKIPHESHRSKEGGESDVPLGRVTWRRHKAPSSSA